MSKERNKMLKSLREIVIPELRKRNFKGSFPHFRKTENGKTNLLTFQFDRNGGGFVIELANWNESEFKTHLGEIIPLNKLTVHDLNERQRIYPISITEKNGKDSWFRYNKSKSNKVYKRLAHKVVERLPVMEQYWAKNKVTEVKKPVVRNGFNLLWHNIKSKFNL